MSRIRISTALLLLAVVTVALTAVPQVQHLRHERGRSEDRANVRTVSRAAVLDLTTLRLATLDTTLKRMERRLTGPFARQFTAFFATFASVVRKQHVTSRGSVQSVAVSSSTADRATALVAARAVVTSKADKRDVHRAYRFALTLRKRGDVWFISGIRFVS